MSTGGSGYYVLDENKKIKEVPDVLTWANEFEEKNRKVAHTKINEEVFVSTVFLGLDHNWGMGPPLVFETMIFGGPHDEYQTRYSTWDEAVAGHEIAVKIAKDGINGSEEK